MEGFRSVFAGVDLSDKGLEDAFEGLDTDGSGRCSDANLEAYIQTVHKQKLGPDAIASLMAEADTDRDGEVDLEEFKLALASTHLAEDDAHHEWVFLGAGVVLLLAACTGIWHLMCSDSDGPMPAEISSVGPPDGRGRCRTVPDGRGRPDGSGSQERRGGGSGARCGGVAAAGLGVAAALDRQKQKRMGGARVHGRRVRFAAPSAGHPEQNEDMVLLRNAVIDVEMAAPKDMIAATEEERQVAVLESIQALERAQYEGHRKRVERTTQIELKRFWGPEATPQLIDEPVPLAL